MTVLVKTNAKSNTSVYHLPSEGNETVPKCGQHHGDGKGYTQKNKSCVPNHRPCKRCSGNTAASGWAARNSEGSV